MRLLVFCLFFTSILNLTATVISVPDHVEPVKIDGVQPRNVVFILSDDHRFDAMGFMGHPLAVTPQMDAMAQEGVHLKNAFVTTSLCSPSRASILTGLYTFRHRVIDNNRNVPAGTLFFPQYIQAAGYTTAYIGKWHMGHYNDDPRPGFDHWVSFRGQGRYLPTGNTLNVNGQHVPQQGYITSELTDYAVDWLEEQRDGDQPFFLYLSHKAVHANFTPETQYDGSLTERSYERPATEANEDANYAHRPRWLRDQRNSWHGVDFPYHSDLDIKRYYQRYCEALRSVDDSIKRVMDQLEAMGIADETLVIYMGDNGFMFGEHGLIDKRVAYETSIRVPLLMRCPDLFAGGMVVDEMVANIDIGPSVMAAMGLETPAHMDGRNFLPLAQGQHISWRDQFLYVYYWEKNFPQTPTVFALRTDRYKLINYYGLWDVDELYDLQNDPDERINLLHQDGYAEIGADLHERLYASMDELGGMEIPLNVPTGSSRNKRLETRQGRHASDFPATMVIPTPINHDAR